MPKKKIAQKAVENQNEAERARLEYSAMIAQPGWARLTKVFQLNIEHLKKQIFDKTDAETGNDLTEEQCDELRFKASYLQEIMDYPQRYIRENGDIEPLDLSGDPYFRERKEMHVNNSDN